MVHFVSSFFLAIFLFLIFYNFLYAHVFLDIKMVSICMVEIAKTFIYELDNQFLLVELLDAFGIIYL